MNALQRAIKYISRKKVRSIVLFLILIALAISFVACLTIRNSANTAAQKIKEEFGASFTIAVNPQKTAYEKVTLKDGSTRMKPTVQTFSPEMVKSFLQIDGVINYRSDFTSIGAYFDLEVIPGFYEHLLSNPEEMTQKPTAYDQRDYYVRGHYLDIYCVLNSETQEYFDSGAFELIEGRHINMSDNSKSRLPVLISNTLAERNGLKVGDSIVGENRANIIAVGHPDDVLAQHTFEIVGIYKINFKDEPSIYTVENEIAENFLFSGFVTDNIIRSVNGKALGQETDPNLHGISKLTLFVASPEILGQVMDKVTATDIVDWDYFNIYEDDTMYQDRVKPLQSMIMLTTGLLVVFILAGLIILSLLVTMWTKSRKHEIAVYLSVGLSKRNILWQLMIEIILLALVALILGSLIVLPMADGMGNAVADGVVPNHVQEQYKPIRNSNGYFRIETVSSEPVELDYAVSVPDIAGSSIILLAVALFSVALSAGEMMRQKPKKLLQST